MERFAQRESVLLGYNPQKPLEESMKTPQIDSDMDFDDVFGGPPRRFSTQEIRTRYSLNEPIGSDQEDADMPRSSWSGLNEKPVFGAENVNRRRIQHDDFFADIFRGDESYNSPRRSDRDAFSSTPGSRVLSPARLLPPKAEPFGTSLPAQFSFPAKVTKGTDLPVFATGSCSTNKNKDVIPTGISSPYVSNASLSRFSSQAVQGQDETRTNMNHHRSPLSFSLSHTRQNSSDFTEPDESYADSNFIKDSESIGAAGPIGQFHFSIYKWASKGAPMLTPLRWNKSFKSKDKTDISLSSIESHKSAQPSSRSQIEDIQSASANVESEPFKVENQEQTDKSNQDKTDINLIVEKAVPSIPESISLNGIKNPVQSGRFSSGNIQKKEVKKLGSCDKSVEEDSVMTKDALKANLKTLHTLLSDLNDKATEPGKDEINLDAHRKASTSRMAKATKPGIDVSKSMKKTNERSINSNILEPKKTRMQGDVSKTVQKNSEKRISPDMSEIKKTGTQNLTPKARDAPGRGVVKGKVKDFVKIFSDDASFKPKDNVSYRSRSFRWKGTGMFGTDNEASINISNTNKNTQFPNVNEVPDASSKVEQNLNSSDEVKEHSQPRTSNSKSRNFSANHIHTSSPSDSLVDNSNLTGEKTDDPFSANFVVEELSLDQQKSLQQSERDSDAIHASDAKIQKWSDGKKGNIRSLLSTLQYVLWPQSGWKPVALVDIIEGSAVKRAYQKALLCLHPDKLQQKGAASHEKYIAEKVFDILQEAWDHFNSLGAL